MKNRFAVLSALAALFVLIVASRQAIESARYGLQLCLELILPSLFPFFLVSLLLSRLGFPLLLGRLLSRPVGKLFRVSGVGATAFVIGLCGGYPMGAAYLADMLREGLIREDEAEHLLSFCNNSGPAFLVGAVGAGVFGSARLGLALYGIHALAALLTGLLFRRRAPGYSSLPPRTPEPEVSVFRLLPEALQQTVTSLLNVSGFVVCFTVFTGLLNANGLLEPVIHCFRLTAQQTVRAVLIGFWEIGGGIGALRGLPPTPLNLAAAAGLVGWGGVSVQFQTLALLSDSGTKGALHLAGRLSSALLSFCLAYLLFRFRS